MQPYVGMILINPLGDKTPYEVLDVDGQDILIRYLNSKTLIRESLEFLMQNVEQGYAVEYGAYMDKLAIEATFNTEEVTLDEHFNIE